MRRTTCGPSIARIRSRTTSRRPTSRSATPEGATTKRCRAAVARPPTDAAIGKCCKVAPPVLVYDQAGNLVKSWGGPGQGYDWPDSNHGITVDHKGNVWLAGNGDKDTQMLKFDGAGKFLLQIGKHGVHNGSNDIENFWQPTKIFEDVPANEVYIGDGYGNRRVIVLRRRHRQVQAALGRLRQQAERRNGARLQPERPAVEAVQHRALRDRVERRVRLRLRPRQRSHPGLPQGRHVRQGSRSSTRTRSAPARCGT